MANESYGLGDSSYTTVTDLSTKQYTFVKSNAVAGQVAAAGNGDRALGILQTKPDGTVQKAALVRELGKSKLVVDGSGSAIAAGDLLGSDGSGRGIKVTADHAWVSARAEEASAAAGDIIEVTTFPAFTISA